MAKETTAVEWLHENNKVIAQMLLDNKISQSIIDQLFNCFVINLEQAKQMEARQKIDLTEICKCDSTGQTWVCNCCGRTYIENKNK